MIENKTPLPKYIVMLILIIGFVIMAGGYVLFYQAQKKIAQKDREYSLEKEKVIHAEENYNDLKKKYSSTSEELKQVNRDYETILQKHQECKEKQEELQTKFDDLQQVNEKNKKDLRDAQTKLGITPEPENVHPVHLLNQSKDENSATTTTAPATQNNAQPQEKSGYQCPASEAVTANANTGSWKEGKITWWVDYTRRPLNIGENVNNLFKILFDGQSIACYYAIGNEGDAVWMVVKGDSKGSAPVPGKEGWTPCPTDECISICDKENISKCTFTLK